MTAGETDLAAISMRAATATSSAASTPASCGAGARRRFGKLDPRQLVRNPVIFVTAVAAVLTTILFVRDLVSIGRPPAALRLSSARSRPGCGSPSCSPTSRKPSRKAGARRRPPACGGPRPKPPPEGVVAGRRPASEVPRGRACAPDDLVLVEAGEVIPGDGDVVAGIATVDESAITGESAPVIRESGGDRSAVTGGTRVVSDRHRRADHGQSGRKLPRPHDRAGRRRQAPEDAERDRAEHPAGRHDHHLPGGGRDAGSLRAVFRHHPAGGLSWWPCWSP